MTDRTESRTAPARNNGTVTTVHTVSDDEARQSRFGGLNWGSAFFGWLVATGISTLVISLLTALGSVTALTALKDNVNVDTSNPTSTSVNTGNLGDEAQTIGLVGGLLVLLTLAIAYYAGGYVAGRMSRFDGARQGFGVWALALIVTLVLALLGAIAGAEYNILEQLNLPRIPVDEGDLTTGGLVTLLLVLVVTLVAAVTGGKAGQRFHDKVDATTARDVR